MSRGDGGGRAQASVEVIALVPVLALVLLCAWQAAMAGWALTAAAAKILWRCAEWRANVIALAFGSLGMFAWFFLFPNHTYVHPQLVSRLLGLSAGFGLVALLLSAQKWRLVHGMRWF